MNRRFRQEYWKLKILLSVRIKAAIFNLQLLCTSAHLPAQKAAVVLTFSCSLHNLQVSREISIMQHKALFGTWWAQLLWYLDKFREFYLQVEALGSISALGQREQEKEKWPRCPNCTCVGNKYWASWEMAGRPAPGPGSGVHWIHRKFTHGAGN